MSLNKKIFQGDDGFYYDDDCNRIIEIAAKHNEVISFAEARMIWEHYSDTFCAGWLGLQEKDEDLWNAISYYFTN